MSPRRRIAVLISGTGSNLQAILDAIDGERLDAEVCVVVSNRRSAGGLKRAEARGIPTEYFPLSPYTRANRGRRVYDQDLAQLVGRYEPDLVVLAGWMHILSVDFLDRFPHKVINLHPALPGEFPGVKAIERAWVAAQRKQINHTGVMVHYVVPEVDAGPTIGTAELPVYRGIPLKRLEQQLHAAEHRLIVDCIALALSEPYPLQETLFKEPSS